MKRLLLLWITITLTSAVQAQEGGGVMLSQANANEKGITPMWPRCDRSRLSPAKCFDQSLRDHIIRNFQYPEIAVSEGLSGTVTVEFIINRKGKVEVLDVQGGHRYLQREAIRIIRAIPKMEPGKWGEKPISVAYEVPITFIKPQ